MSNTLSEIVSDRTLSCIVQIESNGDPEAKAKTSTATGLGQFIEKTWLACVRKHRPDWFGGRTRAEVLDLRKDAPSALEMLARLTEDNLAALGGEATDGGIYLAHFAGAATAKKLLRAKASTPASQCFSDGQIKANRKLLAGKTVGQVRAWAERKMKAAGGHDWVSEFVGDGEPAAVAVDEPEQADEEDEPITDEETIRLVQKRLRDLGYFTVGEPDGRIATYTEDTILAYRSARGLPLKKTIDKDLLAELHMEQEGRKVSIERATATVGELAEKVPTIKHTMRARLAQIWAVVFAAICGVVSWFIEKVEAVWEFARPMTRWLGQMPVSLWFALAGAVVLVFLYQTNKAASTGTKAFNKGQIL